MLPRIFIQIPSYRDREAQWTIRDAFLKARHPERVFVGICWQTLPEEDADCFDAQLPFPDQVRANFFHISEARGLGWARAQAQALWQGEEYSLQIDSHMRFAPDWDVSMLDMLDKCDSPDPVLTVYPPGYKPPDNLEKNPAQGVQNFRRFNPQGILEAGNAHVPKKSPGFGRVTPTAACAGGFIFGSSRILRDVPSDPLVYFLGEEPSLALRLWTHGFDLFSPSRAVIYHYYKRAAASRHWNDWTNWPELHRETVGRLRALFTPRLCPAEEVAALGRYGLGTKRSLQDYERFSGADFEGRTIADFARTTPFVMKDYKAAARLPCEDLWPEIGITLFVLGEEGLLFAEAKGEFYKFNAFAARVWSAREAGEGWAQIARDHAASQRLTLASARRDVAKLVAHWQGQHIVRRAGKPAPDTKSPAPVPRLDPAYFDFRTRTYTLLGATVAIRYGDRNLEHRVHPVLAHLESDAPAPMAPMMTVVRIGGWTYLFLEETGTWFGKTPAELGPRVKFLMLRLAIDRQRRTMLQLHSGAVAFNGTLVLLPARSGSGKTALTARLVAAGAAYFSDEVVLLERGTDHVRPIPVSLCVKPGAVDLLQPHFPEIADLVEHKREDEIRVRYLPPPAESVAGQALRPEIVVFPRYVEGAAVSSRALTPMEAFGRLMDECVAIPRPLTIADAADLVSRVERWNAYELVSGNLDEAALAVMGLCGQGGSDMAAV